MTNQIQETNDEISLKEGTIKLGRLITGPAVLASGVAGAALGSPAFLAVGAVCAGVTYFAGHLETPEQIQKYESKSKFSKFLQNGSRNICCAIGTSAGIGVIGGTLAFIASVPVAVANSVGLPSLGYGVDAIMASGCIAATYNSLKTNPKALEIKDNLINNLGLVKDTVFDKVSSIRNKFTKNDKDDDNRLIM